MFILPEITCSLQYLDYIKFVLAACRPKNCCHCGHATIWGWGFYYRKSYGRDDSITSPELISLQRFYCPKCHRTTSVLPEFMSPRRWYLWQKQQQVLLLSLAGLSLTTIAKKTGPARSTIARWLGRLQEQFRYHKDVIVAHEPELGLANNHISFWQQCLAKIPLLSRAMLMCHYAGVTIP